MTHVKKRRKTSPWTPESQRAYMQASILQAAPDSRPSLREFAEWLAQRGLGSGSITGRVTSARAFVDSVARRSGNVPASFRDLTPNRVERFFIRYGRKHGKAARRSMQAAMRLLLRFSAERGWTPPDLIQAVPSMRSYRLTGVPRGLSNPELSRLLSSLDAASARDRAIVHVLATYGVRRQQVSALRLHDVDWLGRRVIFAGHKGGKTVTHALTPRVADSLAKYLRRERPAMPTDSVFLRSRRPYLRLSPACVTQVVRQLMTRAGLSAHGPHALRHAFATRLLAAGQPVKAIADLLGHRSLDSVSIYAKLDYARLLEVADKWPEVVS